MTIIRDIRDGISIMTRNRMRNDFIYYLILTFPTKVNIRFWFLNREHHYLDGLNWTSSTVSPCPWNIPRASTAVPSPALPLDKLPLEPGDLWAPWSAAKEDIWSWMLHNTTDLSLPVTNVTFSMTWWTRKFLHKWSKTMGGKARERGTRTNFAKITTN